ncbi:MAG: helix-turn-helix domain-containing protein [Cyanobacteriota bacterium]|nr:helix-turn-helix domain-containing protein [Cyanobacteriota bacterium]
MVPGLGQPIGGGDGFGRWHRLRTIDQVAEAIPYDQVQVFQLDINRLEVNLGFYACQGLQILFSQSSAPLKVQGYRSPDYAHFSFSLSSHTACRIAQGCRVSHLTMGGLRHDQEINIILPADMIHVSLQVSQGLLREYLQAMQRFDLDQVIRDNHFLHLPQTLPPLVTYLQQFQQGVRQQPESLRSPHQAQLILDDLIPLVVNTIPPVGQAPAANLSGFARYWLVREAEDYIMAHLQEPLTVKDLCQALHCSRRPLFYAFEEVFGVSPMVYLKARRLQAVKSVLQFADPDQLEVMEVARRFGFWSSGHFARDYQRCFGERPRDTLRQTPPL